MAPAGRLVVERNPGRQIERECDHQGRGKRQSRVRFGQRHPHRRRSRDIRGTGRHRPQNRAATDRQPGPLAQQHRRQSVNNRHHHPKPQQERPGLLEVAQPVGCQQSHFQQEQRQRPLEPPFEERLDRLVPLAPREIPRHQPAHQQHHRPATEHLVQHLAQRRLRVAGRRRGLLRPAHHPQRDRDAQPRAFQKHQQGRHKAFRLNALSQHELRRGDERDRRDRAVVRGNPRRIGRSELSKPPQNKERRERRDDSNAERGHRRPGDLGQSSVRQLDTPLKSNREQKINRKRCVQILGKCQVAFHHAGKDS